MSKEAVITLKDVKKNFKNFTLDIPSLNIPKGFSTALIGENGAGKTTLLKLLSGMKNDYKGDIEYFGGETDERKIRESIGYTSSNNYFMPTWTLDTIKSTSDVLFDYFSSSKFDELCYKLDLLDREKTVKNMSDGMKMKAELAAVLARETKVLLLDEPASPLDPLMRDRLCSIIQDYIEEGDGEHTVLFSTHNVADMENITDYAIIIEKGKVVEEGFVLDLKEKYVLVKGEACDADKLKDILIGFTASSYYCEGLCEAANLDKLAGLSVATAVPTLTQISVCIMKQHTNLSI